MLRRTSGRRTLNITTADIDAQKRRHTNSLRCLLQQMHFLVLKTRAVKAQLAHACASHSPSLMQACAMRVRAASLLSWPERLSASFRALSSSYETAEPAHAALVAQQHVNGVCLVGGHVLRSINLVLAQG